jgi:hypothetical protein
MLVWRIGDDVCDTPKLPPGHTLYPSSPHNGYQDTKSQASEHLAVQREAALRE